MIHEAQRTQEMPIDQREQLFREAKVTFRTVLGQPDFKAECERLHIQYITGADDFDPALYWQLATEYSGESEISSVDKLALFTPTYLLDYSKLSRNRGPRNDEEQDAFERTRQYKQLIRDTVRAMPGVKASELIDHLVLATQTAVARLNVEQRTPLQAITNAVRDVQHEFGVCDMLKAAGRPLNEDEFGEMEFLSQDMLIHVRTEAPRSFASQDQIANTKQAYYIDPQTHEAVVTMPLPDIAFQDGFTITPRYLEFGKGLVLQLDDATEELLAETAAMAS